MIDERALNERVKLIEKELSTLTEQSDRLKQSLLELKDLKMELNAFKVFLGRHHPGFKKEFLEILEKLKIGSP